MGRLEWNISESRWRCSYVAVRRSCTICSPDRLSQKSEQKVASASTIAMPSTIAISPSSNETLPLLSSKVVPRPVTSSSIANLSGHGAASCATVRAIVDEAAPTSAPQCRRA